MTQPHTEFNAFEEAMQLLTKIGPEGLAETFRILLNQAMRIERSQSLSAQPYERTPERRGGPGRSFALSMFKSPLTSDHNCGLDAGRGGETQ